MLAIVSPAETLDHKRPLPPLPATRPRFEEEAKRLAAAAQSCHGPSSIASREYWSAARHLDPSLRVIEIDFREKGPEGLRFDTLAAKRARGMMTRWICEHRDDPERSNSSTATAIVTIPGSRTKRGGVAPGRDPLAAMSHARVRVCARGVAQEPSLR